METRQTIQALHSEAQHKAFDCYLRRGRVPKALLTMIRAAEVLEQAYAFAAQQERHKRLAAARSKYSPAQPRAPAGRPDGGQWVDAGHERRRATRSGTSEVSQTATKRIKKRAMAIYGETSGLYPRLLSPMKSPYEQSNWEQQSAKDLQTERTYIGVVSERNTNVNYAQPLQPNNPIQARAWRLAEEAARNGENQKVLHEKITHFFLRQNGIGLQRPPWPELQRYMSLGPFNNFGGGDVPRGANTYVDFYGR